MNNRTRRPTHPGEVIREIVLPELAMTQKQLAKKLHITQQTVSALMNGRKSLTPDMAIKLANAIGGTADTWLRMQQAVDLWDLEYSNKRKSDLSRGFRALRQTP